MYKATTGRDDNSSANRSLSILGKVGIGRRSCRFAETTLVTTVFPLASDVERAGEHCEVTMSYIV